MNRVKERNRKQSKGGWEKERETEEEEDKWNMDIV